MNMNPCVVLTSLDSPTHHRDTKCNQGVLECGSHMTEGQQTSLFTEADVEVSFKVGYWGTRITTISPPQYISSIIGYCFEGGCLVHGYYSLFIFYTV